MPATTLSRALLRWYAKEGRAHLPWRQTRDPYRILVSEFMLQQTQVERVLPKYEVFLRRFPNFEALAGSSTADVVRMWQGLGYNSRALRLKQIAGTVVAQFGAVLPSGTEELRSLPGIGAYTAAAVRTFAFEIDEPAIDTNIRRVLARALLGHEGIDVEAQGLQQVATRAVPKGKGHDWNSALMDIGSAICTSRAPKCLICPLRRQCAAAPIDPAALERSRRKLKRTKHGQETLPFEKTTRYARGRIVDALRDLPAGKHISFRDLQKRLAPLVDRKSRDFRNILRVLAKDGLIDMREDRIRLSD